jgi:hypothetical protein
MNDRWKTIAGRVLSALVVLVLLADGGSVLLKPEIQAQNMAATGFPMTMAAVVGVAALAGAILYAIPLTAVFGAILITAFCGGAISIHVRIGEIASPPQIICVLIAVVAWAGLWLRDPRLRALLPIRG